MRKSQMRAGLVLILSVLSSGILQAQESDGPLQQREPATIDGYRVAPPGLAFGAQWPYSFPADYAAHEDYRAELWQWSVAVEDSAGRLLGVGGRMLRVAIAAKSELASRQSPWHFNALFVSTQSVVDYQSGEALQQHTLTRAALDLAGTANDPVSVWVRAQQLELDGRDNCGLTVDVDVVIDGQPIKLELQSSQCAIPGSSIDSASVFGYTQTITTVNGSIGEHNIVSGSGWIDRAWGELPVNLGIGGQGSDQSTNQNTHLISSAPSGDEQSALYAVAEAQGEKSVSLGGQAPVVADQFRLRLSDDKQIIVLQTRRRSGKGRARWTAFRIDADLGVMEKLEQVEVESLSSWTSPESKHRYASGWRVSINATGAEPEHWQLTPVALDQEMRQYGEARWIGFARVEYQGELLQDAFAVVDLAPGT